MTFAEDVAHLCDQTVGSFPPTLADEAAAVGRRLDGPLRVAFAGRVKAGKSTLLNALVGERLAPTDAGECTRVVTAYEHGAGYEVEARLVDGTVEPLAFHRNDGLTVDLGARAPDDVERLVVRWPSRRLSDLTLIDTPGLASVHGTTSARTEDFLTGDERRPDTADAVIYLMRHVHRRDVEFLDAFMDRRVAHASPANAVAVLSRADEIGGGRLDGLDSARRIAERYADDDQLRTLVGAVVPVAGLLAETGTTLREDEVAALRALAAEPDAVLDRLLVTADRFVDTSTGALTVEVRTALLDRFGLFGLRFCVDRLRRSEVTSAAALSEVMVAASGLGDLQALIAERFLPRARVLQARTALVALRSIAERARADWPEHAAWLLDAVERVESRAGEVVALRLLHLVVSGQTGLDPAARDEIRALVVEGDDRRRLGLPPDAAPDEVRRVSVERAGAWHARAGDPIADPATVEACEAAARLVEAIYATT